MSPLSTETESMPKIGTKAYEAINEQHCADPQVGDYWHEMLCPYLVVLGRIGAQLIVCQTRKDVDRDHWTWDLTKLEFMTLTELRQRVTYGTMPGFVADVFPRAHVWAAKECGALHDH